jgi:hypothetical protein
MEHITSIKFDNYKALSDYSIALHGVNVLVGPNNCGKSTIIGAFRLLDLGLKKARSKKAEYVSIGDEKFIYGFNLDESEASISLENVSTDYNHNSSSIVFRVSNGNRLILFFPNKEECVFTWENTEGKIDTPGKFREAFPINIQVVPVLGPIEHEETVLTNDTIKSGISTHRSSRHFRNYWYKYPEGWDQFQQLIERTWPGMSIKTPELIDDRLRMFCSEKRIDREIFWAGFGFQIWCQLLTHLSRTTRDSLVIIDEPEIYLHPDVQRQLIGIIKETKCDAVIATHSVEIISDVEPSEIVLIDKERTSARRLRDIIGVQKAIEYIGSTHNITLAQLARTRKMIFAEGQIDFKIIRKFAKQFGFIEIANENDLTWFESGGFTSWENIRAFAWGIEKTVDEKLSIATIYDRDYYCDEEIEDITRNLESVGVTVIWHIQKEIENYLLVPSNITKAIYSQNKEVSEESIKSIINSIVENLKAETQGNYIGKRCDYYKRSGKDISTISTEALIEFDEKWKNSIERMKIIPGKKVLSALRQNIQDKYGVSLSETRLIEAITIQNAPEGILDILQVIEQYRITKL